MAKGPKPLPLEVRFWSKVDRRGPDECWPWQAAADRKGYGRILVGSLGIDRHMELAHRASWRLARGAPPPAHLSVLHRCDNPPCCNPAHLFLGTIQDNNADMRAKGRQSRGAAHSPFVRGERNSHAKLTEDKVRQIRAAHGTLKQIGAQFGIDFTTVWGIRTGKSWKHVGASNV